MKRWKTILVATDFSDTSRNALDHAVAMARRTGARLHILHVIEMYTGAPAELVDQIPESVDFLQAMEGLAQKTVAELKIDGDFPVDRAVVRAISAGDAVVEHAKEIDADLVCLGSHGRSAVGRAFMGSVSDRVVKTAACDVMVVGQGDAHKMQRDCYSNIVVPVDFSEHSQEALRVATTMCADHKAKLTAVHVVEGVPHPAYYIMGPEAVLEAFPDLLQRTRNAMGKIVEENTQGANETQILVMEGRAHKKIAEAVREHNADLVVIQRAGLGKVERLLLGSVTTRLLHIAPCPILVLHAP